MEFIKALEAWGIPLFALISIVVLFLIFQLIGAIGDAANKTMPAFMQIFKIIKDKKKEKAQAKLDKLAQEKEVAEMLAALKEQQAKVEVLLIDVQKHYNADNIAMRDKWMLEVNTTMHWAKERAKVYDASVGELTELGDIVKQLTSDVKQLNEDLRTNNSMTAQLYKDINRHRILDFAHNLVNNSKKAEVVIYTEEEINKIRDIYEDYEKFLHQYGGTNGQVDNAMKVIDKAERGEFPNIRIVHDLRDI